MYLLMEKFRLLELQKPENTNHFLKSLRIRLNEYLQNIATALLKVYLKKIYLQ